jgi:hypothetical protein
MKYMMKRINKIYNHNKYTKLLKPTWSINEYINENKENLKDENNNDDELKVNFDKLCDLSKLKFEDLNEKENIYNDFLKIKFVKYTVKYSF